MATELTATDVITALALRFGILPTRARDREHHHQCGARAPMLRADGMTVYYPGHDRRKGCGAIWRHSREQIFDYDMAHCCPKCGRESTWAIPETAMRGANPRSYERRMCDGKGLSIERAAPGDVSAAGQTIKF